MFKVWNSFRDADGEPLLRDGVVYKAFLSARENNKPRLQVPPSPISRVGDNMHLRVFALGELKRREALLCIGKSVGLGIKTSVLGILAEGIKAMPTRLPEVVKAERVKHFSAQPGFCGEKQAEEWAKMVARTLPESGLDAMKHMAFELLDIDY